MGALLHIPSVAGTGSELISSQVLWPPPQCWLAQACQREGTPRPHQRLPWVPRLGTHPGPRQRGPSEHSRADTLGPLAVAATLWRGSGAGGLAVRVRRPPAAGKSLLTWSSAEGGVGQPPLPALTPGSSITQAGLTCHLLHETFLNTSAHRVPSASDFLL